MTTPYSPRPTVREFVVHVSARTGVDVVVDYPRNRDAVASYTNGAYLIRLNPDFLPVIGNEILLSYLLHELGHHYRYELFGIDNDKYAENYRYEECIVQAAACLAYYQLFGYSEDVRMDTARYVCAYSFHETASYAEYLAMPDYGIDVEDDLVEELAGHIVEALA